MKIRRAVIVIIIMYHSNKLLSNYYVLDPCIYTASSEPCEAGTIIALLWRGGNLATERWTSACLHPCSQQGWSPGGWPTESLPLTNK